MVRVNVIEPRKLADQHLIAEYNEILMLVGHMRKHGLDESKVPEDYCLGTGHITFFKNKLVYLKKRHEALRAEMRRRHFKTERVLEVEGFDGKFLNDWSPKKQDAELIKARLRDKLKMKPNFYRYYGENRDVNFFLSLIEV